jgi:hypothetical protein
MDTQFGKNLDKFRYLGERNPRFAERLGVTVTQLRAMLKGALPESDEMLDSMALRLGIRDFELFSGSVWPS